jgi:histidinol phosphatase-like enzyme (inositol monophosphatase family)
LRSISPRLRAPSAAILLEFAHELADAAGRAILPHFRRRMTVDNKASDGGYDPVTAADRAAERIVRKLVRGRFPDHGFEGEEYGNEALEARFRWVVDPIDGTRAFVLGLPVWGTLIGLTRDGEPVLGLMDQPFTRERFWADGRGAYWRDPDGRRRKLRTRASPSLAEAMMTTTHPDLFAAGAERRGFETIKSRVRACRYGGDCYTYCLLAAGHIDLIVEAGLKPYDVTALVPIVERAGGVMTTWDGAPASRGGRIVAAGDPRLHAEAMKVLLG